MWLAHVWNVDLIALTDRDTLSLSLVRGALTSVVILLVADFLWQVVRAAVDAKLAAAGPAPQAAEGVVHQALLRTLLPIFRNMLFVIIMTMAALTALAALGVEISPLIAGAGAGVVGVAVGFGAQTLVKDVISGVFYLLDDSFRVGEYIQSGAYKGAVGSFSLRSVKLRHHRGPIFTVPFGQLGAVQNMSRDWVIDKFQIGVTYDSDLDKARRLIKKIGQELQGDPEFGHNIIEPMKIQGVEQFGGKFWRASSRPPTRTASSSLSQPCRRRRAPTARPQLRNSASGSSSRPERRKNRPAHERSGWADGACCLIGGG